MAQSPTKQKRQRRPGNPLTAGISGGVSLLFVAGLWLLFAPTTMGGKFAYFFVVGNSMEPRITASDLVFLRAADRYDVGDVVGYRDPILGTVVHRIRAVEGDQYVTRGDNRDSDDSYRPFQSDVVGREWYILNNGAKAVRTFQSPKSAVALTVLSVAFGVMTAKPRAATRRMRKTLEKRAPAWAGQLSYKSMAGDSLVTLSSTLLFTALGLAAVLAWNGSERVVTKDLILDQTGKLEYTASAGTGLYDGDRVSTGQPIFTQIGTQMPVSFTYEIVPASKDATVGGVRGMVSLAVELSQDNRWKRVFEILPPTPFAGTVATAQGAVDLKALQETAARMEQAALLKYPLYSVRVVAEVKASANISGRAQDYTYRSEYPFELQALQLVTGREFKARAETPLNVKRDSVEPWSTTIPVAGTRLSYTTVQVLTLALGVSGAGALALVYVSTMLAARGGETSLILARYAPLLVSVQAADVDFGGRIVAVKKFEDLVRMARADGLFVVHAENGVADHFLLVAPEVTYLYSVPRPPEKYRFDEVKPSPGETLAGLTRPDTTRPLAAVPAPAGAGASGVAAPASRNGVAAADTATPAAAAAKKTAAPAAPAQPDPARAARPARAKPSAPPPAAPGPEVPASPITGARPLPAMPARAASPAPAPPDASRSAERNGDSPRQYPPATGGKALV